VENVVMCAASKYEKKFFLDPRFDKLPEQIKAELKIICVLYTNECGGIITMEFDEEGNLLLKTASKEEDILYDEISAGLKIREIQKKNQELFEQLELYYAALNGRLPKE